MKDRRSIYFKSITSLSVTNLTFPFFFINHAVMETHFEVANFCKNSCALCNNSYSEKNGPSSVHLWRNHSNTQETYTHSTMLEQRQSENKPVYIIKLMNWQMFSNLIKLVLIHWSIQGILVNCALHTGPHTFRVHDSAIIMELCDLMLHCTKKSLDSKYPDYRHDQHPNLNQRLPHVRDCKWQHSAVK